MKPDEDKLEDLLKRVTDENIHDEVGTGDSVGSEAWSETESATRLAELGGSEPELRPIPRRKPKS